MAHTNRSLFFLGFSPGPGVGVLLSSVLPGSPTDITSHTRRREGKQSCQTHLPICPRTSGKQPLLFKKPLLSQPANLYSLLPWPDGVTFVPSCKEGWEHGARVTIIALDQPATAFLLGLKTAILNKTGLLLARRERGNDVRLTTMVSATRPRQELGSSSQGLTHIGVKPMPERGPVHCPAFPSQLRCHWSVLFCTDSRPLCLEL